MDFSFCCPHLGGKEPLRLPQLTPSVNCESSSCLPCTKLRDACKQTELLDGLYKHRKSQVVASQSWTGGLFRRLCNGSCDIWQSQMEAANSYSSLVWLWARLHLSCFRARRVTWILIACVQENNYITSNAGWQSFPELCWWPLSACSKPATEKQDII